MFLEKSSKNNTVQKRFFNITTPGTPPTIPQCKYFYKTVIEFCIHHMIALWFTACLPVHSDLVVGLGGNRDPVDVASVVGVVNLTKQYLTTLLTTTEFK